MKNRLDWRDYTNKAISRFLTVKNGVQSLQDIAAPLAEHNINSFFMGSLNTVSVFVV